MKKIVLIICVLRVVSIGVAQDRLANCYRTNMGDSIEYEIDLYSNGAYKLFISEQNVPYVKETTILSRGSYTVKNNRVNLFDAYIGFQIQYERKLDKLKVIKGFPFMLPYILNSYGSTFKPEDIQKFASIKMKIERKKYNQEHPNEYPLYYSQYINGSYVLEIEKGNKFVLTFKSLLLAKGTWKRVGNELSLFDETLQHTYYVFIATDGLIGKYLPGNFSDLVLYERNYPEFMQKKILTFHYRTHETPVIDKIEVDIFDYVEEMPQFADGGDEGLRKYLKENTKYTDAEKQATTRSGVIVRVVIEKDGSIGNAEVIRGIDKVFDKEALRVVKSMPKWIPGRQNGIPVAVYYLIRVDFSTK